MRKFPWCKSEHINISQRRALFNATCQLLRLLNEAIQKNKDPMNLNAQLCRRLTYSAMTCPGFTVCMKDDIVCITNLAIGEQRVYNHPPMAEAWRHQYALAPKPDVQPDVLEVREPLPLSLCKCLQATVVHQADPGAIAPRHDVPARRGAQHSPG